MSQFDKKSLSLQYKITNWLRPVNEFLSDMYWAIVNSKIMLFIVTAIIFTIYPFAYMEYKEVNNLINSGKAQKVETIEVIRTLSIEDTIRHIANKEGFDNPDLLIAIAKCESGLSPFAANSQSTAVGWYQYLEGTWIEGVKQLGVDWSLDDRTDLEKSTLMTIHWINEGHIDKWITSSNCWSK